MPELPEVETVRRTVEPLVRGRRVVRVVVPEPRLRARVEEARLISLLVSRTITGVRRRAKYLLFDLDEVVLLVHLGMTGRLRFVATTEPRAKHDHVILRLDDGRDMRFNDARRFGCVEAFARAEEASCPRLAHLGVEPLSAALDPAGLGAMMRGSKKPVKSFLMDATKVVGVGNIYACEALFLAGIDPRRISGALRGPRVAKLASAVRQVLTEAIERGGTTLRDFVDAEGARGAYGERLRIYGKGGEPCSGCGRAKVRRIVQAGRSTFFCPRCQR